jgi:hypothetical protein
VGWTEGKRTKYAVRKRVESPSLPHLDFLILPLSPPPLTLPLALSRVVLLLLLLLDLSLVFEELGGLEEGLKMADKGPEEDFGILSVSRSLFKVSGRKLEEVQVAMRVGSFNLFPLPHAKYNSERLSDAPSHSARPTSLSPPIPPLPQQPLYLLLPPLLPTTTSTTFPTPHLEGPRS